MGFWFFLFSLAVVIVAGFQLARLLRHTTVYEYQAALKFTRGRFVRLLAPGSHWQGPWTRIVVLDARPRLVTVPAQEILTRDNVSVKLSLTTTFQVKDARAAVLAAESYEQALYAKLQDALRSFVGALTVEELVTRRAETGQAVHDAVRVPAAALGVEVQSVAVKDIMFPGSLRDAFAQVTKARQDGLAALERARGEAAAVRSLANTARVVESNPYLFQLRLLQSVADAKGAVVINVPGPPEAKAAANGSGEAGPES